MANNTSESFIERKLGKVVKRLGGFSLKFISPTMPGVPDRLVFLPWRRLYLVECKSATGVLSKLQTVIHKMFNSIGWKVYIISNEEELDKFEKEVTI